VAVMTRPFVVRASREGDWWYLEVEGVEGGYSQARRLDQVESTIRDLLALMLQRVPESFDLDVQVEWPADLRTASERASQARKRADEAREQAAAEMRMAAATATQAGYTVRDVAALLDVSPQRVSQLRIAERRAPYKTTAAATAKESRQ